VTDATLISGYDLVIFDLDGVLYLTEQAVAGAVPAVRQLAARKVPVVYATNNASRSVEGVVELLTRLGYPARPQDVITSARATAALLAERYPAASPVLVVGSPALADDIKQAGLCPVASAADQPVVVVQGFGPQVGWQLLAEAHVAVRAGAAWIATNADRTVPSPRGALPGNGSLLAVLATSLNRPPDLIVGKPDPGLFQQAVRQQPAARPLVVGDRLDTDIEGANRAGMDSLFVLTGVSRPADLLAAEPHLRPTYVAEDLAGFFEPGVPLASASAAEGTGWNVVVHEGALILTGQGAPIDALRALCAPAWARRDSVGNPAEAVVVRAQSPTAVAALGELGLA